MFSDLPKSMLWLITRLKYNMIYFLLEKVIRCTQMSVDCLRALKLVTLGYTIRGWISRTINYFMKALTSITWNVCRQKENNESQMSLIQIINMVERYYIYWAVWNSSKYEDQGSGGSRNFQNWGTTNYKHITFFHSLFQSYNDMKFVVAVSCQLPPSWLHPCKGA